MSSVLETVSAERPVFRIARTPDPWAWPAWSQAGPDGTFGNRWDDCAGQFRVLYASSTRYGALLETLARFRPDLAAVALPECVPLRQMRHSPRGGIVATMEP